MPNDERKPFLMETPLPGHCLLNAPLTSITKAKLMLRVGPLVAGLGSALAGYVGAQTFTTLHTFTPFSACSPYVNSDGANPNTLASSGSVLYGATEDGGSGGNGLVFRINMNGTGFAVLHNFMPSDCTPQSCTNADGTNPQALLVSASTLCGAAERGGSSGNGTVFKLRIDGTAFTILDDPNSPMTSLVLEGNMLYGVQPGGGNPGSGQVFKLDLNGTGLTVLHTFSSAYTPNSFTTPATNSDGGIPTGLIPSSGTLYGTASFYGNSGCGTVFALNTDGTEFRILHSFVGQTNGAIPKCLILSGSRLYGTTGGDIEGDWGTVFALNTDGTGFITLHSFSPYAEGSPRAGLVLWGNTLYGTASYGGSWHNGTVFALNIDGTGFRVLHSFSASSTNALGVCTNSDGGSPLAGLILAGNTLYGAAATGGSSGNGTIYSISLQPELTLTLSGRNAVLTWSTNFTGYALQATPNFVPPVWTTNLPAPVIVNGQFIITNAISRNQQFFRLSQ